MPALEFTVSHLTSKDDIPALVQVEREAFSESAAMQLMYPPSPSAPANIASGVLNYERAWRTDANAKFLKAALPDGKIIGMAKWYLLLDAEREDDPWTAELPENANAELYEHFFGSLNEARRKVLGGKRHILMAVLVVDPEYQRMGVGNELLRWGLDLADEEQVECWIDASPAGFGLYKKFGWEEVGAVEIDLERWGGEKGTVRRIVNMVRPPKAK